MDNQQVCSNEQANHEESKTPVKEMKEVALTPKMITRSMAKEQRERMASDATNKTMDNSMAADEADQQPDAEAAVIEASAPEVKAESQPEESDKVEV